MLEVSTKVKRIRGTDHCQRGHNRWGYVRGKDRYCLDCENYRAMRRKYERGILGEKGFLLLQEGIDFEIGVLQEHIEVLRKQIGKLKAEKSGIRKTYKSKKSKKK